MNYSATYSPEEGFVRFTVLVDVTKVKNVAAVAHQYNFAYQEAGSVRTDGLPKIAVLAAPDDRSHDFVEIVLHKAGIDWRRFHGEREAVEWLNEGI